MEVRIKGLLSRTRLALAETTGAATRSAIRRFDPDRGSHLPGRIALLLDPTVLTKLAGRHSPVVFVTGTNGKTTTTALLAEFLSSVAGRVATNQAGANLESGVVAALLRSGGGPACLEVDEGAVPSVLERARPDVLLLLNLARDQLDRYGEIDTVARRWVTAIGRCPPRLGLVANADDSRVAWVASEARRSVEASGKGLRCVFFGLGTVREEDTTTAPSPDHAFCPSCSRPLDYEVCWTTGGGRYGCSHCGFRRPDPQVWIRDYVSMGLEGFRIALDSPEGPIKAAFNLPALHNLYNACAAAACALMLGVSPSTVEASLPSTTAAYGRAEAVSIRGKRAFLLLSKNPQSTTENLALVRRELERFARARGSSSASDLRSGLGTSGNRREAQRRRGDGRTSTALPEGSIVLAFGLNDRLADGQDVSWIWDVDFEGSLGCTPPFVVFGDRAESAALRLVYDGWDPSSVLALPDPYHALTYSLAAAPPDWPLPVLCTYTAMRTLRAELVRRGLAPPIDRARNRTGATAATGSHPSSPAAPE